MPGDVIETAEHHVLALVTGKGKAGLKMAPRHFQLDLAQFVLTVITLQQGNQLRGALPFVGSLVFQQYNTCTALDHTQANRRVIEHDPVELFAFSQGLAGPLCGLDDLRAIPAVDPPTNQHKKQEQASRAHDWPYRIAEKFLITDRIQTDPGLGTTGTQFKTQTIAGKTQAQWQLAHLWIVPQQHVTGRGNQSQAAVGGAHQQAVLITDIADIDQGSEHHRTVLVRRRHEARGNIDAYGAHYVFVAQDQVGGSFQPHHAFAVQRIAGRHKYIVQTPFNFKKIAFEQRAVLAGVIDAGHGNGELPGGRKNKNLRGRVVGVGPVSRKQVSQLNSERVGPLHVACSEPVALAHRER